MVLSAAARPGRGDRQMASLRDNSNSGRETHREMETDGDGERDTHRGLGSLENLGGMRRSPTLPPPPVI